ncbi:MAG: hypothetical protein ACI9R3_005203 [Verrucomicrobiales bacterium]|jgi:hypothetical protein
MKSTLGGLEASWAMSADWISGIAMRASNVLRIFGIIVNRVFNWTISPLRLGRLWEK